MKDKDVLSGEYIIATAATLHRGALLDVDKSYLSLSVMCDDYLENVEGMEPAQQDFLFDVQKAKAAIDFYIHQGHLPSPHNYNLAKFAASFCGASGLYLERIKGSISAYFINNEREFPGIIKIDEGYFLGGVVGFTPDVYTAGIPTFNYLQSDQFPPQLMLPTSMWVRPSLMQNIMQSLVRFSPY